VLIIKCSQALYEYMRIVQKVAGRVMELMAEGLGMQDTGVFRGMVHRDSSDELLRVNLCYIVRGYEYGDTDTGIRENGIF
jgi:isopenicillin N synthase-like dioxygenase